MIPINFLSKLGLYEFETRGVTLKVRVADNAETVDLGISELMSQFGTMVAGVSFHDSGQQFLISQQLGTTVAGVSPRVVYRKNMSLSMLQLCVGNRCLIVQLTHLNYIPDSLPKFFENKNICFVGVDIASSLSKAGSLRSKCKSYVELSDLVARFVKKPSLCAAGIGLEVLAREVGVDLQEGSGRHEIKVDWKAKVFTEEEIKYIVRDVHAYYLIAKKIFG